MIQACSLVSMHHEQLRQLGEGTRRRKKLINQPNENIPTDAKTSYSHIKVVEGG